MLQHRTILITGGGSGIGEALALQLAKTNRVIICGRNEAKLQNVCAANSQITYEVADLSDPDSIDRLFVKIRERSMVLDVLINNAGVAEVWDVTKIEFTSQEIFEKINTNLTGAIAITQHFICQADLSTENFIINNTSEIVLIPVPIMPLYSASKAGLSVFTRALRVQLKDSNFKVIELMTPAVDTDMPRKLNNRGKLANKDEFAGNVIRKVTAGAIEYAPGANVFLLKFFQRFAPKAGLNLIDKMSRKQLRDSFYQ